LHVLSKVWLGLLTARQPNYRGYLIDSNHNRSTTNLNHCLHGYVYPLQQSRIVPSAQNPFPYTIICSPQQGPKRSTSAFSIMGLSSEAIIGLTALCVSLGPIFPVLLRYFRKGRSLPRQSRGRLSFRFLVIPTKFSPIEPKIISRTSTPKSRLRRC